MQIPGRSHDNIFDNYGATDHSVYDNILKYLKNHYIYSVSTAMIFICMSRLYVHNSALKNPYIFLINYGISDENNNKIAQF